MSSAMLVEDHYHLKSEWQPLEGRKEVRQFRHRHSREEAQLQLLAGVPMRHLEALTAREAYSFCLCPRVHKCMMVANYCTGNELRTDLAVLVQKPRGSFAELAAHPNRLQMTKKLEKQIKQLVQGFQYLCSRYGPFLVNSRLVSWNSYDMVRVWLSQDVLASEPESPAEDEQAMVSSTLGLLEESLGLRFWEKGTITCFEELVTCIEQGEYQKMWESSRKVKFQTGRRESQLSQSHRLFMQVPKSINLINSNASIQSKSLRGGQLAANNRQAYNFQFDRRSKRSRGNASKRELSSQKPVRRNRERTLTHQECQAVHRMANQNQLQQSKERSPQNDHDGIELQQEKENVGPKRKESKTMTCMVSPKVVPLRHHSRTYSNTLLQDVQTDPLFRTQQLHSGKRKSSLLRLQLEEDFDGLFHSNGEVSFDSSQLEKELEGVL